MAGTLTLLVPLDSDAATLSGGDWAMDLALLQDIQPTRTVQSTDAQNASTIIKVHFTSAIAVTGLAFGKTNLGGTARLRISGASSEGALGSAGYVGSWIDAYPTTGKPTDTDLDWFDIFKTIVPGAAYAWWQIEIDDDTNADGFVEIGRLYIGEAWQPDYNFTYGSTIGHAALDLKNKTETGFTNTEKRGAVRYFNLSLDVVSQDDAEEFLYEFRRRLGTAGDVFVCTDPEETTKLHRKMMMATAEEMPDTPHTFFGHFKTVLKFWELR